ncbi:GNAT family N-acetyltransferase [Actinomadura welshii]
MPATASVSPGWTNSTTSSETEAVYLHRLVIHRDYAGRGLGAELIDWAGRKGASRQRNAELIRIDVWTDNTELHEYYRRQGFTDVAIRTTSDNTPSGALFEKPLASVTAAPSPRIVERPGACDGRQTKRTSIRSLSGVSRQ